MKFKIVSDSSSNIFSFPGVAHVSVPLRINAGEKEYVDDENLDVARMVAELREHKGRSGTSCPNVHDWLQAFEGADRVFAVAITSNLSGSCAAALEAKAIYEETHPEAKVCVLDTLSTGPEMGLIMEKLRQRIGEGLDFEKIVQGIREYMKKTHLLFSLESLTNLARNGRVSPAVAKIAGVLGIRVVGAASAEGTLQQLHKCRGEKKGLETVLEEMKAHGFTGGKVRINHAHNPGAAQSLLNLVQANFPNIEATIAPMTGLCCFYAERGSVMIGFEG